MLEEPFVSGDLGCSRAHVGTVTVAHTHTCFSIKKGIQARVCGEGIALLVHPTISQTYEFTEHLVCTRKTSCYMLKGLHNSTLYTYVTGHLKGTPVPIPRTKCSSIAAVVLAGDQDLGRSEYKDKHRTQLPGPTNPCHMSASLGWFCRWEKVAAAFISLKKDPGSAIE